MDADAEAVQAGPLDTAQDPGGEKYRVTVTGSQGVYVGDHGIQVNLFTGERPRGPVVAGNVPPPPPAFRPRAELMTRLRAAGPGVSVVRAVTGMRGVGKTQLAAAYARERIDDGWRLVAWVAAEDTTAVLNGLGVVAARLGLDRPGVALEAVGAEVRSRLEADGDRCLIVFDNVTDPDVVRPYLPAAGRAEVIITSTDTATADLGAPLAVDVFTEEESLGFLADRTGRSDPEGAVELAAELGRLPLALAQAAAVVAAQRLSYPVYLDRLRGYPTERYLPRAKGDPYPHGVAEAIGLSVDAAADGDPTGVGDTLLGVVALLSPDGVARRLLHQGAAVGAFASPVRAVADPAVIDEALGRLADASLLAFAGDDVVTVHRLTMRAVRERAGRVGAGLILAVRACALLDAARSALGEPRLNRAEVRAFAQHVAVLNEHLRSDPAYRGSTADEAAELTRVLLNLRVWAVSLLTVAGDAVTQAVNLAEPLLADCEGAFGPQHPRTLSMRTTLAAAYRAAGRLDDATIQYERVLAERERSSPSMAPDTLTSRNNLAVVYNLAGRTAEAIALLERTVADRTRVLGADYPDTLTSRNNLASAYAAAGRMTEARREFERVAADRTRVLGADHPDTLRSRANLAGLLGDIGRADDAIPLYEQVTADYQRILGPDHPETLAIACGLARCHYLAGHLTEAIAIYQTALPALERGLGPTHPTTRDAQDGLDLARQQAAAPPPPAAPPQTA